MTGLQGSSPMPISLWDFLLWTMKRKWASCSRRGRLTFDTDLLRQPAGFRKEAIVHELLHLKLPNHGKVFKSLVKAYLAGGTDSPPGQP